MADDDFAAFMQQQEGSAPTVTRHPRGTKLRCPVIHIGSESVFVDLGMRAEGRIPRVQLQRADGSLPVAIGDMVEATVVEPEGEAGPLLSVTLTRDQRMDLSALQLALESQTPVEGRVTQALKGGLEVELNGVRAFCPASQAADGYVADLSTLVGEPVRVLVMEIREEGRSVVVSRRKLLQAERAAAARAAADRLHAGAELSGTVTAVQKYGAFVDVGGIEGLVHISELSTTRVDNPEDVVSVGEQVQVKVLGVEQTDKGPRVRLSLKALQQTTDPTEGASADEILTAKVTRMLPHGVVVQTPRGEGMIPLRELGLPHGADHRRAFSVGQEFEVTWLGAPSTRPRFSITRVEEVRSRRDFAEYREQQAEGGGGLQSLGALLGKMDRSQLPPGPPPKPPTATRPTPAPSSATQAATDAGPAGASSPAPAGGHHRVPAGGPNRMPAGGANPAPPPPHASSPARAGEPPAAAGPTAGSRPAPEDDAGGPTPRRRRIVSKR